MSELRQYVPTKVVGAWTTATPLGAIDILDGTVGAGEFAAVELDNANWSRESDKHGNATRVFNANDGGRIRITLTASSPTNTKFSKAVQADKLTHSVVGPLLLKDLNGNTVIEAEGAFLVGLAPVSFGSDRGTRVWTFECAKIRMFVGGHDIAGA